MKTTKTGPHPENNPNNNDVSTIQYGTNADLIREVARLYAAEPNIRIADLTYGKGVFWRKCPHLNVTGSDIITVPERPYDFRATPYKDGEFDIAVFDPPYVHHGGGHMTSARYQLQTVNSLSHHGIRQLYVDGIAEAMRITSNRGQIWVKGKDQIESGIQRYSQVEIALDAAHLGLYPRDLFQFIPSNRTANGRWSSQHHARKHSSFLWIFEKDPKKAAVFLASLQPLKPTPRSELETDIALASE